MLRPTATLKLGLPWTLPSDLVGGGMASGWRMKLVAHESGRLTPPDDPHGERVFRSERHGRRWRVERDWFSPAFGQQHRGETNSQIVFAADMELREIDAVHVR